MNKSEQAVSSTLFSVAQMELNRFVIPTIIMLGNIGNIFIVILFSRRRQNSCSIYLLCAAVTNSIAITFSIIYTIYSLMYGDPTLHSLIFCKFRFYIPQVFSQTARYLTVFACIDRFILTTNRAYYRFINRPIFVRNLIGINISFWCIFLCHLFLLTTMQNGQCGQFGINYILYFVYLLIFVCLCPFITITIFGLLAYRNLKRLHRRVQPIMNSLHGNRRDRELLIMVLGEVFVYLVTTLPYPLIICEIAVTDFIGIIKSNERREIESFFFTLSIALIYLNCSAPFYTYMTVSKVFRQDFINLFHKCKCPMIRRFNAPPVQRIS